MLLAARQARHEAAAGHAQAPHPATRAAAVALDVESLRVRHVFDEVVAMAAAALVATTQRAVTQNSLLNSYVCLIRAHERTVLVHLSEKYLSQIYSKIESCNTGRFK